LRNFYKFNFYEPNLKIEIMGQFVNFKNFEDQKVKFEQL